jgi:hypothetical protein
MKTILLAKLFNYDRIKRKSMPLGVGAVISQTKE